MSTKLTLKEIQEQLDKKDISPELRKSLKDKKDILANNKIVKK
jgi:hypothetical protein